MAIIPALPNRNVIDGYRHILDFYVHKGQVIVRMWPRKPLLPRTLPVQQGINDFTYINQLAATIPPVIRNALEDTARGTGLTWRDYLIRAYISGIDY